jgi:hypothetical protein
LCALASGAILGAIERSNLREDINNLYLARLEAKYYISQYKLVLQNLERIGDLFENYVEDQTTEAGRARLARRLANLGDNFEAVRPFLDPSCPCFEESPSH